MRVITIVGFMGAGKTTVGHILADRLGLPFVDTDVFIEQRYGRAITDIFAAEGEEHFREIEHRTINELVRGSEAVLALGGGAIEDPRTQAVLRNTTVVYLTVSYAEAMSRVHQDTYRPLLRHENLSQIYGRRLAVYGSVAAVTVSTDGRRPDAVAQDALRELNRLPVTPKGTSSVLVTPVGGSYNAHIGAGILDHTGELLPDPSDAERAVIVRSARDGQAADRVARSISLLGLKVDDVTVDDSERAKTFATAQYLAGELADRAVHKDDLVIAVGGEAVCDLAGFVAATYNRGTRLALVPTTLAAQADSAIGGKNALNMPQGRNLVGTIHQPVAVVADVEAACANIQFGFEDGLAEIVKHALISQGDLRHVLARLSGRAVAGDAEAVLELVVRSVEVKADIVSRDERAQGERVILNYGHTFAHAIEYALDSDGDDHGRALSLGIMAAGHLSRRQGRVGDNVVEAHRDLLAGAGLPTRARLRADSLRSAWLRDKKYRHGVRFVVLNGLGRAESGVAASDEVLRAVLDDLAS